MPPPPVPPELESLKVSLDERNDHFKGLLEHLLQNGFWFCKDCQRMCEREEGENGQIRRIAAAANHRGSILSIRL